VNIKTALKTSVASAALMALAVPVAMTTPAQAEVKNSNGNSLELSGHVNRSMIYVDNGDSTTFTHVDNNASQTRFRVVAKGAVSEAIDVDAVIEMDPNSEGNQGGTQSGANSDADTGHTDGVGVRHARVGFSHKQFGKITLGHTSMATDGTLDSNKSGAGLVTGPNALGAGSGINFWNDTTNVNSAFTPIGSMQGTRTGTVKYDAPTFGGLSLVAAHGTAGAWDVAGYYGATFGGFSVSAAAGYANYSSLAEHKTYNGSLAVEHESGINARIAGASRDWDTTNRSDSGQWYVGLGYDAKFYEMGETSFAVGYMNSNNGAANAHQNTEKWEVGVNQKIDAVGTDLYLGVRNWSNDDGTATDYDDIFSVIAGARVAF
jgi:predicted porin